VRWLIEEEAEKDREKAEEFATRTVRNGNGDHGTITAQVSLRGGRAILRCTGRRGLVLGQ